LDHCAKLDRNGVHSQRKAVRLHGGDKRGIFRFAKLS
jgi:hypothetical protein